jgi:aromatic-L-amino-acid decarboxylase
MIAELYSASVSNPGFNWVCSPACTELEQVTMDWMADILGLQETFHHRHKAGGGGVILNSASEAALTAAIAARGDRKGDLVMYGSTQTHSLGAKAALILGVQFRAIAVGDNYRLKGERLEAAIRVDLEAGLVPFFVSTSRQGCAD